MNLAINGKGLSGALKARQDTSPGQRLGLSVDFKNRALKGRGESSRPYRAGTGLFLGNPGRCPGLIPFGAFSAEVAK